MEYVKREFRLKNFGFCDTSPEEFYRFQFYWPGQPTSYVVYRVILAFYQTLWNSLVIIYWDDTRFYRPIDNKAKWPIYLSNWSFFFLTLYFVIAAASAVTYHFNKNKAKVSSTSPESVRLESIKTTSPILPTTGDPSEPDSSPTSRPLPWYFKVTWCLQTIASSAVLFVAMGYWFFEYDPALEKLHVFTLHVHAVGTVLAIIDFTVSAHPFRILHFVYPMLYFTVYVIFTVIYYYAGGLNPYGGKEMYEGLIDWEDGVKPSVFMALMFTLVVGPVLHAMYFGLYLLRRLVAGEISVSCQRCRRDKGSDRDDRTGWTGDEEKDEDRKRLDNNIGNGIAEY
ncbi:protein rolling stone-like [Lytechinus variegatus]|uniref:protein rolling stone-like n=1 Tax=Lytechinus variegatus TaxID=7654 RepID=UPI001BB1EA30|nr:protein rolling stone-like [Lytechinus variegatus]